MDTIKVGIIQQSIGTDIEQNKEKLAACIRDVAAKGAELVVLQELHNSPYFCQVESTENFSYAEPIPGPSTDFYGKVAAECKVVTESPHSNCYDCITDCTAELIENHNLFI